MKTTEARELFEANIKLAYWVARRIIRRKRPGVGAEALEELVQEGVIRGWERWCSLNCDKCSIREPENCAACVRWCVTRGTLSALRERKVFGSVSSDCAVRDDIYSRRKRTGEEVNVMSRGKVCIPEDPLAADERKSVEYAARRNGFSDRQQTIAGLSWLDWTQEDIGKLLGVTSRTVQSELKFMREVLS